MYNNNMNVALCLSGQPRDLKIGIDSIKNNIILPNQNSCNFDVFCHYWFNENLIGQPFDSAQQSQNYKMGMWDQNTHEYINNLSPRDSFYESPKTFDEFSNLTLSPEANQSKLASLFYSMWMANEMKRKYEKTTNTVYDLVIRARYDLAFFKSINLLTLKEKAIHNIIVASKFQEMRVEKFNGGYTLTDLLAISNSKYMDIFCNIYPNFVNLYNKILQNGAMPYGENYLGQHVRVDNSLYIYHTSELDFNLVRNI